MLLRCDSTHVKLDLSSGNEGYCGFPSAVAAAVCMCVSATEWARARRSLTYGAKMLSGVEWAVT